MGRASGFIEIIRPVNSVMMGFAVIVGCIIAGGFESIIEHAGKVALGFATGFFLCAASMVLNDYFDREIDKYNAPRRPIPSGRVKPEEAVIYSIILAVLGLASATFINRECLFIALSTYVVSVLYSSFGKKTGITGNLMVSYTVMIPLPFAGALVGEVSTKLIIFSLIIFLANTGREITKGITDVVGDRIRGVKTLAVLFGSRTASLCAFLFYALSVLLSPLPYILGMAGKLYLILVLIVDAIIIDQAIKLVKKPSKETAFMVKNRILYAMLLGLIAFMLSSF